VREVGDSNRIRMYQSRYIMVDRYMDAQKDFYQGLLAVLVKEKPYFVRMKKTLNSYLVIWGDAPLIHGLNDSSVSYTASVEMLNTIYNGNNSELFLLAGADAVQGFDSVQCILN
ncbi:MAG: hypothetical protein LUF78_06035, partial [Clostridiales bacterium]|nr:hypothetical protein [Clostridiales bacterium]